MFCERRNMSFDDCVALEKSVLPSEIAQDNQSNVVDHLRQLHGVAAWQSPWVCTSPHVLNQQRISWRLVREVGGFFRGMPIEGDSQTYPDLITSVDKSEVYTRHPLGLSQQQTVPTAHACCFAHFGTGADCDK